MLKRGSQTLHGKTFGKYLFQCPRITIFDFDLLRVVGKGAFGKVMLVRKRKGLHAGEIFALKVMQKSVVVAHGQQRHALAERTILERVSHPFIVQLRFAFQNDQKLYLVTSFYPGGNLFFHLRRSGRGFDEPRAAVTTDPCQASAPIDCQGRPEV